MILVLLLILAYLLWLIQGELAASAQQEPAMQVNCPGCHGTVEIDWLVCPRCRQQLRQTCSCCHKSKLLSQTYCPFCGEKEKRGTV